MVAKLPQLILGLIILAIGAGLLVRAKKMPEAEREASKGALLAMRLFGGLLSFVGTFAMLAGILKVVLGGGD